MIPALRHRRLQNGLTLIEITLVIFVLITFASVAFFAVNGISDWRAGKEASEQLRTVYAAQRAFLADHVTRTAASITEEEIIPYLPGNMSEIPKVKTLEGTELTINFNVSPPVVDSGDGSPYDPSGSPNDGVWDVGE